MTLNKTLIALLVLAPTLGLAQDEPVPAEPDRIQKLEERLAELEGRLAEREEADEAVDDEDLIDLKSYFDRLVIGGYGEVHANLDLGPEGNVIDVHRLILFAGYNFATWIRLETELEVEHGFIEGGESSGDVVLEQAFVDFYLGPINLRFGRTLLPMGIVNRKHEPPSFNGVERPSFAKYIIPTTWFSDGIGIYSNVLPQLSMEAYVVGGLDGSEVDDTNGLRSARLKERPSLQEPAFVGRIDLFPMAENTLGGIHWFRIGFSTYLGGLNNGNKGNDPDVNAFVQLYAADMELSIGPVDLRGAIAYTRINRAKNLPNNAASAMLGFYGEVAVHVIPKGTLTGLLARSDLVVFFRYDDFNTQYRMPAGRSANDAGNRHEYTVGIGFYPIPNVVLKADYQRRDDKTTANQVEVVNLGIGWQF